MTTSVITSDYSTDLPEDDFYEEQLTLLGRLILGKKCFKPHVTDEDGNVIIYRTQKAQDWTNWFRVLKVGPQCESMTQEFVDSHKVFMRFPEWGQGCHKVNKLLTIFDERQLDLPVHRDCMNEQFYILVDEK